MTIEYVGLKEFMTVDEALKYINEIGREVVTIYVSYVIGEDRKLKGFLRLSDLLVADKDVILSNIMEEDVVYIHTLDDQEYVLDAFRKYNHSVMPVVDEEMRMVGIIAVDDIIEVMEEEDTEDFQKMSGIVPNEDKYLNTAPYSIAKNRIPWLVLLMLTSSISGSIIASFAGLLSVYAVLNSFIPMLMGTGGNAGNQSSTLIIRGLSTGEIELNDWNEVLLKEIKVSLLLGSVLFVANYFKMTLFQKHPMDLSLIVSLSMFLTIIVANAVGSLLPMLVKKVGMDPANVASPLLTTVVDMISLLIFFNISSFVLA